MVVLQYLVQTYTQLVSNLTVDLYWSIWFCIGFALIQGEKNNPKRNLFIFLASLLLIS